jgi:hypothetical protein
VYWYNKRKAANLAKLAAVTESQEAVIEEELKLAEDEPEESAMAKERAEQLVAKDKILQSLLKVEKTTKRGKKLSIISKHYYHEVLEVAKKSENTAASPATSRSKNSQEDGDKKPAASSSTPRKAGQKRLSDAIEKGDGLATPHQHKKRASPGSSALKKGN